VAVARIKFPALIRKNVHANLSFTGANVQKLLAQREKEGGRSRVWVEEGCDPAPRRSLRRILPATRLGQHWHRRGKASRMQEGMILITLFWNPSGMLTRTLAFPLLSNLFLNPKGYSF
jgi:hypothetical protein